MTFDQIKNTKAFSYTVAIHVVLLLAFLFTKYKTVALPALPDANLIELEAISVALGVDNNGMGIAPPEMMMGMPAPPVTPQTEIPNNASQPAPAQNQEQGQDNQNDNVAMVNNPISTPVVRRTATTNSTRPTTPVATRTETRPTNNAVSNSNNTVTTPTATAPQAKYTFDGATGTGGNGAAENANGAKNRGDGDADGLKGKPAGDPNSMNFSGGVTGRTIVARPDSKVGENIKGTVSVKVYVDREGTIIRYTIQSAASGDMVGVVAQKIRRIKFNRSPEAPLTQTGIITLNFKSGAGR